MANDTLSAMRTALLAILQTVTQLEEVTIGRTVTIGGFPACRFYLTGVTEDPQDTKVAYWRTYTFAIDIMQEIKNKSSVNAEQDFEDAIQPVMDALNAK